MASTRPTRAEQAAARREELLATAIRQFAARGYEGTNLEDIASDAGVTKGLLYHYFGSKRGLFLAGVESLDFETSIDAIPAATKGAGVADIIGIVARGAVNILHAREDDLRFLIATMFTGSEDARQRIVNLIATFEDRLTQALDAAPDLTPDADTRMAAANLVSSIVFLALWEELAPASHDTGGYVDQLVRTTARGLTR